MIRNAYLIHQWPYAFSPMQLEELLNWLAEHGFNAISVAINELDFEKNYFNLKQIFQAAKRKNFSVHAVPSRWCGMVAGVPGIHSGFCVERMDCLARDEQDQPFISPIWGYIASIYAPDTANHFQFMLKKLFDLCPFDGLIWDEPKNFYFTDYSAFARSMRPQDAGNGQEYQSVASFFDKMGTFARSIRSNVYISMFVYGDSDPEIFNAISQIKTLNSFGIDGNPFVPERITDKRDKTLIGTLKRIKALAVEHEKDTMALIENFGISKEENILMEKQIHQVLAVQPEHLLAYYYGRNNEEPEKTMNIIGNAFLELVKMEKT